MNTLRLYNYWRSSASYRVRIALQWKQLSYEYLPIHLVKEGGAQFSAAYRAINPQSRVPSLDVDGQILTQSMAILEWLEETHPQPALLPADAFGRARVRSLAQMLIADVQPLQNVAVTNYLRDVLNIDAARIKTWLQEWIGRGLAAFEARLADDAETGQYCHGDTPTFADLCLVPQCYAARRFAMDFAPYPNIARIEANCAKLDPFRLAAPEHQPDAEP